MKLLCIHDFKETNGYWILNFWSLVEFVCFIKSFGTNDYEQNIKHKIYEQKKKKKQLCLWRSQLNVIFVFITGTHILDVGTN